jgi:hypothetical protein
MTQSSSKQTCLRLRIESDNSTDSAPDRDESGFRSEPAAIGIDHARLVETLESFPSCAQIIFRPNISLKVDQVGGSQAANEQLDCSSALSLSAGIEQSKNPQQCPH